MWHFLRRFHFRPKIRLFPMLSYAFTSRPCLHVSFSRAWDSPLSSSCLSSHSLLITDSSFVATSRQVHTAASHCAYNLSHTDFQFPLPISQRICWDCRLLSSKPDESPLYCLTASPAQRWLHFSVQVPGNAPFSLPTEEHEQ